MRKHLIDRPRQFFSRVLRWDYIGSIPEALVDWFIQHVIIISSFVLYYPYWLWRNRSLRNIVIWGGVAAFLVAEFFGVAALMSLVSTGLQFAMAAMYMVAQFAMLFWLMSNTKTIKLMPGDKGALNFKDHYYGGKHIKEVVLGTLGMMSHAQQEAVRALGAEPPHGMVLTGPPGTGKTLMAQCAATEILIPYIGLTGSDLNAMFMGVAEMKVMGIGREAQKFANIYGGCVVFLDELDSIASNRGGVEGNKNQPQQTGGIFGGGGIGVRSKLLSVMDGSKELHLRKQLVNFFFTLFDYEPVTQGQVFWMGATNRIDAIDPAFLRPGRMDITVQMDPPDKGSRRQIIQGYLNRITHDESVDVERLTDDTQGFTPADVASAVSRISARFTIQRGAKAVSMADIEAALTESVVGVANPIAEFDPGQREQVATHESGHAVVSRLLLPEMRITSLSILRRGKGILGYMRDVSPDELYTFPFSRICARIQVSWAGDIACEVLMGERWAGGSGDFSHVGTMMTVLAQHGVFADSLPLDPHNPFAEERINDAAIEYSNRVKTGTRKLIRDNIEVTAALRDALLEKAELNSLQVNDILEAHSL